MKRDELKAIVGDVLGVESAALTSDVDLTTFDTFDSVSVLTLILSVTAAK